MASTPFERAARYLQQAVDCCESALSFLADAGVNAPLYLSDVNMIKAVVATIAADVELLIQTLENQDEGNVISPISSIQNVDLTVVAVHNLFTVPAGKSFVPTGLAVRYTQATAPDNNGTVAGVRASDAGNVFAETPTMSPVVGTSLQIGPGLDGVVLTLVAADTIAVSIVAADTGTGCKATIDLFGYLV